MSNPTDIPRDELEALMVFLANETLEGQEREAVEAAVAADPQLTVELEALRSIRAEMQAEPAQSTSSEFALARLMRDIGREGAQQALAVQHKSNIWKIAAVIAMGLFAVQSAYVVMAPDEIIDLAGGSGIDAGGPTLIVAFSEDAPEGDIRRLLLQLDLTIIGGPSALGLYTLAASDDASRATALTQLNANSDLVDSAEMGE
ncbi:hypothetical protein MNBD_ALPHA07-1927 [hydrothermal vent metagenome]|uniref:Zinc-finger domain-containing protein n=1 Tax=hydrothermal vent metagenome TaxID=652676 RepID=A0A3B0SBF7_9ZZZZ